MPDRFDEMAMTVGKAGGLHPEQWPGLAHILRTITADEREACAKIAEADTSFMMLQDFGMQQTCTQVRANIADAIRNRKP